jgi:hypothetical protein
MKRLLALIARIIGLLLLLTAFAVLGHDLLAWRENGAFAPTATGQLWNYVHNASLSAIQEAVQRYIAPGLWNPVMVTGLKSWVVPVLAVPGLVLAWAFRKRRG